MDVREILNGERNKELPSESSAVKDVAEYADKEQEKLALHTRIYAIAGIVGMITYLCLRTFGNSDNIIVNLVASVALILVYAALASSLIYTSARLQTLQRKIKMKIRKNLVFIIITIAISVLILVFFVPMLFVTPA